MRIEGVEMDAPEGLDTGSILAQNLQAGLKSRSGAKSAPIEGSHEFVPGTEELLESLYSIRDGLIEDFSSISLGTKLAGSLTSKINGLGGCIRRMGGVADDFEPLNHVSGLDVPNQTKNAKRVMENTLECYKLGKAEQVSIGEDGRELVIDFTGTEGDVSYVATGKIVAEEWNGNEAIDYVYTPGEGRMSVRAFESGRWLDKSDKYSIRWELIEKTGSDDEDDTEIPPEESSDEKTVKADTKKEGNAEIKANINTTEDQTEDFDITTQ